jgi:hypothetical protein
VLTFYETWHIPIVFDNESTVQVKMLLQMVLRHVIWNLTVPVYDDNVRREGMEMDRTHTITGIVPDLL